MMKYFEYFLILLLILTSLYAWFLVPYQAIIYLISLPILGLRIIDNIRISENLVIFPVMVTSLICLLYLYVFQAQVSYVVFIVTLVLIFYLVTLPSYKKIELFQFQSKAILFLFSFSLLYWILYLLGVPLPHRAYDFDTGTIVNHFENYFLFIVNPISTPRFRAFIAEPGYVGMVCSFLLFIKGYDFKSRETWLLIFVLLFTVSLAGLALATLGYFISVLTSRDRKVFFKQFGILLFTLIISYFSLEYFLGKEMLEILIFNRLQVEDGNLAGNNRTTELFDQYYNTFLNGPLENVLFGKGNRFFENFYLSSGGGNASYKVFIINYGVFGVVLVGIVYLLFRKNYPTPKSMGLLILFAISFWQRPYALALYQLAFFILGCSWLYQRSFLENKKT